MRRGQDAGFEGVERAEAEVVLGKCARVVERYRMLVARACAEVGSSGDEAQRLIPLEACKGLLSCLQQEYNKFEHILLAVSEPSMKTKPCLRMNLLTLLQDQYRPIEIEEVNLSQPAPGDVPDLLPSTHHADQSQATANACTQIHMFEVVSSISTACLTGNFQDIDPSKSQVDDFSAMDVEPLFDGLSSDPSKTMHPRRKITPDSTLLDAAFECYQNGDVMRNLVEDVAEYVQPVTNSYSCLGQLENSYSGMH